MITIQELMTSNPYSLRPSDTLEDARRLMTDHNIRHVPITDQDGELRGLITQRGVLEVTHAETKPSDLAVELKELMIRDVSVIHPGSSVRQAGLFLQRHKYGCLPVVDDKKLVGIITDSDFITVAINLIEQIEMTENDSEFVEENFDDLDDIDLPEVDLAENV
jgi:CBS domain-containing protein